MEHAGCHCFLSCLVRKKRLGRHLRYFLLFDFTIYGRGNGGPRGLEAARLHFMTPKVSTSGYFRWCATILLIARAEWRDVASMIGSVDPTRW